MEIIVDFARLGISIDDSALSRLVPFFEDLYRSMMVVYGTPSGDDDDDGPVSDTPTAQGQGQDKGQGQGQGKGQGQSKGGVPSTTTTTVVVKKPTPASTGNKGYMTRASA